MLKDNGVELLGLRPEMAAAIAIIIPCFARHDCPFVITSACEQSTTHGRTSLHYAGSAIDLRTMDHATGQRHPAIERVFIDIQDALNIDFDVIDEGDHIHIEYQPRRR